MRKSCVIWMSAILMTLVGMTACNSEDIPVYDNSNPMESLYGEWQLVGWTENGTWLEIDTIFTL